MISFLSQIFKSSEKSVSLIDADEMGLGRLVHMKDREKSPEESHKDLLSRVKSAEVGSSTQLRFKKEQPKAALYTGWDALRSA